MESQVFIGTELQEKTKTHSEFLVLEFVIEIGCVLDDVHDLQKIVPELK